MEIKWAILENLVKQHKFATNINDDLKKSVGGYIEKIDELVDDYIQENIKMILGFPNEGSAGYRDWMFDGLSMSLMEYSQDVISFEQVMEECMYYSKIDWEVLEIEQSMEE
jgi:hypothetical protein